MFLITGSNGQLAKEFQKFFRSKKIKFAAPSETQLDITDFKKTQDVVSRFKPAVIFNCAAYNFVDDAEGKSSEAFRVNSSAVENLALVCRLQKILLVHYSTDYVFDGKKGDFYNENDRPHPINKYGLSKLQGELAVRRHLNKFLIFRLSWVFGGGKQNFLYKVRQWARKDAILKINADEVSVPTYTKDIVDVTMRALKENLRGLYHLTNNGYASRYEWAKCFLKKSGFQNAVIPVPSDYFPTKAKRPLVSFMSNAKISKKLGIVIPSWEDAVDRFIKDLRAL
ncbi:MAG TPA: dTDP-4-dehydrorhamnose reductase [Candidatus Omnitrophota bacterium]|nr:dTDP-4-dehydrorhamnose reductase [Candidatus Omnitrophota bacterium]HPD84892.1 dTDP-4-dehydrorhamnose reductase [Candidatus Omnitrophota bacterium]HRZ03750.1 dTDP-4-dehydrorhamnose reductase [Candidatus Omnitrophota bacterium]